MAGVGSRWLNALPAGRKAIFIAASQAAKATDFLGGLQSAATEKAA
jgi:antirestriction protein ArdC